MQTELKGESAAVQIAHFAVNIDLKHVPLEIRNRAKDHFLDAIGVGLASSSLPRGHQLQHVARGLGSGLEATGLGLSSPLPASSAAFLNGALIHSLEFDDTHIESIVHGSSVVAATALAVAERQKASGGALLTAFIAGWEVFARLGLAAPGAFQASGFQVTACAGPFAAAVVASILNRLDENQLVHALGISGSQACGTMEYLKHGATVKACHPGWAAHGGVIASALAAAEVTGPTTIFEGSHGLYSQFARDIRAGERFTELCKSLGERWCLADTAIKPLPCCHYIQPFIECLEHILNKGVAPSAITEIVCHVPREQLMIICNQNEDQIIPRTWFDAKFSLSYCIGARLAHGYIDIDSFEFDEPDPVALKFANFVSWQPRDGTNFPKQFAGRVEIKVAGGRQFFASVDDVYGSSKRPLLRCQLEEKFRNNARRALTRDAVEEILDQVGRLETLNDLGDLSSLLRQISQSDLVRQVSHPGK